MGPNEGPTWPAGGDGGLEAILAMGGSGVERGGDGEGRVLWVRRGSLGPYLVDGPRRGHARGRGQQAQKLNGQRKVTGVHSVQKYT